jgi:hypothetical protein
MQSHEIPSDQWVPFFNDLSKRHQGEHVTVESLGRHFDDRQLPKDQSLVGISVDPPTGACKIDVMVGSSVAHEVTHPIHVRLSQNDAGNDTTVEIDTCSGACTLVRFLSSIEQNNFV